MRESKWFLLLVLALSGRPAASAQEEAEELQLPADFTLEMEAAWEPLTDTVYKFEQQFELVKNLAPAAERRSYAASDFRPLLPPGPVKPGDVWPVDPRDVLVFLRQLHPGATERLHHGPAGITAPGGWACLRALHPTQAEILLRVHAEFVIDGDGEIGSSYLTPAQFEGRMVIDRERGVVSAFQLAVPDQSANVDFNIHEDDGVTCDIGRFPRMEVRGGTFEEAPEGGRQIPLEEARDALANRFYPFADVGWMELPDALEESRSTGKPLHVIALFGSLTDESC